MADGGARVSTGVGSKQDHGTPLVFMQALTQRFGAPVFDLAADRRNHKHPHYFAPKQFREKFDPGKTPLGVFVAELVARGAWRAEVEEALEKNGHKPGSFITVPNHDDGACAFDAFDQNWAAISLLHPSEKPSSEGACSNAGPLFLNPEWADIMPWAERCLFEAKRGARILQLTLASNAEWYTKAVAGRADVYELDGRISFNGAPFMKDCILSHFHPWAMGAKAIWDWKRDRVSQRWAPTTRPGEFS